MIHDGSSRVAAVISGMTERWQLQTLSSLEDFHMIAQTRWILDNEAMEALGYTEENRFIRTPLLRGSRRTNRAPASQIKPIFHVPAY